LTRLYDPVVALTMREQTLRGRLPTVWGTLELLSARRS
jgi:hypothetical protein